jgi:Tol biopolymer transport system component
VRIPVQGGTPTLIVKLKGPFRRAYWSSDGQTIVYGDSTGLYTVPAKGGAPTLIIEHPHIEHPSFLDLPDGRQAILYQVFDNGATSHAIYVQVLGEDRRRLVTPSTSSNPYPAYSPSGHIVYVDGTGDSVAIWALPFSLATLEPTGKAFPLAQHGSSPQVSRTGTLVYTDVPSDRLQLVWSDRSGQRISTIGEPQRQNGPVLSPDNRRLVVEVGEGDPDTWIYDLDRGIKTRFTFDSAAEILGAWTPSGDEITYASNRGGNFDIFSKPSNGNGEATLLFASPQDEGASDWSPDQRFLIYDVGSRETKRDVLYRERGKTGSFGAPAVFLQTPFNEGAPRFSPDGRFVVYISDESGQNEIYVRDFPKGTNKWRISTNRGTAPRWSRNGKEIFYVEQRTLMAVSVTTQPAFSPGTPARLFEKRTLQSANPQYDVSADGKRFIILDRLISESLSIHVVHNWFEEFRGQETKK